MPHQNRNPKTLDFQDESISPNHPYHIPIHQSTSPELIDKAFHFRHHLREQGLSFQVDDVHDTPAATFKLPLGDITTQHSHKHIQDVVDLAHQLSPADSEALLSMKTSLEELVSGDDVVWIHESDQDGETWINLSHS